MDEVKTSAAEMFTATPHDRRKARREGIAKWVFFCACLALILPVLTILGYIFVKAWPVLSWEYIWENPRNNSREGGIWAPLIGTFYLVLTSLVIVAPVGILAGVYLNEYAPDNWLTRSINMAVTSLAGVPSIVHGLFGAAAFVFAAGFGESLLAASLTIAVMTLPVIITATREALNAVPMPFREACWNMGATRWQTIRTIVLPNSVSGMLTGVILEVARAAGETAPILLTGAIIFTPGVPETFPDKFVPYYLGDQFMALSMHLHAVSTQIAGIKEEMQFGTAAVLIALILFINSFSAVLRSWLRSRKKW
jgi:phosphate transport system permease protein